MQLSAASLLTLLIEDAKYPSLKSVYFFH
jgi:hypothetical protein